MDVNPLQPPNVPEETEVILVRILLTTSLDNPVHPLKALLSTEASEPGITTDVNDVHLLKSELPMTVTLVPNVNVFSAALLVNGELVMVEVIFRPMYSVSMGHPEKASL